MIVKEIHDSIAILRMQHGKVNAIDIEFFTAFQRELIEIEKSSAKAILLTGSGNAFSAGVDLFRLLKGEDNYVESFLKVLCEGLQTLFFSPKPVIAAVNGHAIAGGCILACSCDYKLGVNQGLTMGVTELLVGVPFPAIALEIIRFAVAPQYFQQIVYSGKTYPAAEALRFGLLDEIVAPEILMEEGFRVASRFAELPENAFVLMKKRIREPLRQRLRLFPEEESHILKEWRSPQTQSRIRNYLDRTIGKR
jgi:enoyl-CoA hydratase